MQTGHREAFKEILRGERCGLQKTGGGVGPVARHGLGRRAIDLRAGLLNVKGAKFHDGTVEVDAASKPRRLFIGLAFHNRDTR